MKLPKVSEPVELDLSDKEEVSGVMFNKLKEGFEDKIKRDTFLFRFFECSIR